MLKLPPTAPAFCLLPEVPAPPLDMPEPLLPASVLPLVPDPLLGQLLERGAPLGSGLWLEPVDAPRFVEGTMPGGQGDAEAPLVPVEPLAPEAVPA